LVNGGEHNLGAVGSPGEVAGAIGHRLRAVNGLSRRE
jgi:hypothetical protein